MTIEMEGAVGSDITTASIRNELQRAGGEDVTINVNSPGGAVFSGYGIGSELRRYSGKVTVRITGLAASIASYIATQADYVIAEEQSNVMIHDPATVTAGNSKDHQKSVELLERLGQQMAQSYAMRMGISIAQARTLMREETWYSGQEIVDVGLADEIDQESAQAKAQNVSELVAQAHSVFDASSNVPEYARVAAALSSTRVLTAEERSMCAALNLSPDDYLRHEGWPGMDADPRRNELSREECALVDALNITASEYLAQKERNAQRESGASVEINFPTNNQFQRS
jgi:ATP-dependent protease ClpP protease subunit